MGLQALREKLGTWYMRHFMPDYWELSQTPDFFPDDPEVLPMMAEANAARSRGNMFRALGLMQEAAERWPGSPGIHWCWADMLEAAGRPDEAERVALISVALAPQYANGYRIAARCLVERGEHALARVILDRGWQMFTRICPSSGNDEARSAHYAVLDADGGKVEK